MISVAGITISSPDIGMGHLVRTTQLLTSLDPRYFKFKIFGQIESIPSWLDNFDYEIINFEKIDLNIINNYDLVVFDSYWNRNLLNKISTKKLIIDDLNYLGESNSDIILDYNFGSKKTLYDENKLLLVGPEFFPISNNSFPEFIKKKEYIYNDSYPILLSFGGVSDESLIDIKKEVKFFNNFGDVYLMDPLNKLEKYENKVKKRIINKSLSEVFSSENIKFCKVAGGTSKYIALAHKIPFLYVYRNDVEKLLIDKMLNHNLTIKDSKLEDLHKLNKVGEEMNILSEKYDSFFRNVDESLINKFLIDYLSVAM